MAGDRLSARASRLERYSYRSGGGSSPIDSVYLEALPNRKSSTKRSKEQARPRLEGPTRLHGCVGRRQLDHIFDSIVIFGGDWANSMGTRYHIRHFCSTVLNCS